MPWKIEVALFVSNDSFYPSELEEIAKSKSDLSMRIEVIPEYINNQEYTYGAYEEIQKLYDNLQVGESVKTNDEYHHVEMVAVRRFLEDYPPSIYQPRGIFKMNIFKGMLPGEIIKLDGREFHKNKDDDFIYVYEAIKSTIKLVEVDTRMPWTIESYDGEEYIKYLSHVVVDERYNYYQM